MFVFRKTCAVYVPAHRIKMFLPAGISLRLVVKILKECYTVNR